jgi:pimeloyl-ACP methyl ester carboxylesterase
VVNRKKIPIALLFGLILSVSACGFPFGQTKTSEDKSSSLDQMIDVGGYRLHINCAGNPLNGSATVVMDAGGYDSSESWNKVQPEIAKFTRICVYDRANLGKSERRPNPSYTSQEIVNDLHTLLVKANIASPFVLVGHSFGGMNMRLYASQYPKEIVGMVLVDSVHEDEMDRWVAMLPSEAKAKLSDADKALLARLAISEGQVRAARWHTDIPLVVLSHGIFNPGDYYGLPAMAAQGEKLRLEMQEALARLSSLSKHIIAEKSGHNIQRDQPELVIDSVRQVVDATRTSDRKRF